LDHTDAFTLLVAVLLSAQCTDVRVNQITPALYFKLGRTPAALAAAPLDKILKPSSVPVGLGPQKAKAIKELSGILLSRASDGQVPASLEALGTNCLESATKPPKS
jgi:endonuclease-3